MQTFLPLPIYRDTAEVLDYRRLGKQRVETLQLLRALSGETKGWANHPACRMWRGHEGALCLYGLEICKSWIRMGYRDACYDKICAYLSRYSSSEQLSNPVWVGNKDFHAAHRSNLLRKDKVWYSQFGWRESDDLPYVWPV